MNNLCPHKQNPNTCLTCYRAKPRAGSKPREDGGPAVEQNRLGAPMRPLPGRKPPPVLGNREGAQLGEQVSGHPEVAPDVKEKYRYPRGRPSPQLEQVQTRPAYSTARAWGTDKDGVAVPPPREQLIDSLPQHPLAPVKS